LGNAVGRLHLERIAENGIAGPVDYAEAFRQDAMAAGCGIAPALLRMAWMMLGLGTEQSVAGALDMYNELIERGNADAMMQLAVHYLNGVGVEKDARRGRKLLRKAAAMGNEKVQEFMKRFGIGPETAFERLKEWLGRPFRGH
jgi:TPR repeat protein